MRKRKKERPVVESWVRSEGSGHLVAMVGTWTTSEMNRSRNEHWAVRKRRKDDQQRATSSTLATVPALTLPVIVLVERLAPAQSKMDEHDNLRIAVKHVVDAVADWLGVKDNDPRITWTYGQEKSKAYGVRITAGALS